MTKGDKNIMNLYGLYKDDKGDTNMRGITNAKLLLDRMREADEDAADDEILYEINKKYSTPFSASTLTPVNANIRDRTSKKERPTFQDQLQNQFVQNVRKMSGDNYDTDSFSSEVSNRRSNSSFPENINPLARARTRTLTPSQKSSLFSSSSGKFGVTPKNLVEEEFDNNPTGINPIGLDNEVEGERFSQYPQESGIQGGDPKENIFGNEADEEYYGEEEYDYGYDGIYGDNDSAEKVRTVDELYSQQQEQGQDGSDEEEENNFDDFEQEDGEDFNLQDFINLQGHTPIRENFIITLFSNIINQLHKASDFWDTNITPNLSDIPKLKMDSFIKSKAMDNFEKALEKIESKLTSGTIKTYLNYLDNIYHNLTTALDDLFTKMDIDIKRYAGGLSSSSSKPQLMGAGYLPFRGSVYSSHLRNSNTKYLM
jgi:hypothetical protein